MSAVHQALEGSLGVTQSVELHEGESPEKSSQQDQLGAVSEPVVSGASHLSGKSNGRELAEGFEYCGYFLFCRLKRHRFINWVRPLNCHLEGYVSN